MIRAPAAVLDESRYRTLHAGALLSLFVVGMYAGSFGPALPFFAKDLGVSLDTAGLMLTAMFAGSISASAVIAVVLHGRDTRALAIGGAACTVSGLLLLGLAPTWPLALIAACLLGTGDGLIVASLHILMSVTSRDVRGAISRLNLYFAWGAIAGPLWAGALLETTARRDVVYAGVAGVSLCALALMSLSPAPDRPPPDDEPLFRLPSDATTLTMGVVLFMYVGAEFGLGSWVSSYARQSANAGVFVAAVLSAGFWLALAIGRLATGAWFARGREAVPLLAAGIAGAGIASLALALVSGNLAASAVAAFCAGLCLGPIWPTVVAIVSERGEAHATAATVTVGNAGGLAIPWLQGRVLVGAGPAQGVAVTAALCALMLGVVGAFRFAVRDG
ncbi:MAG TPA: MFS transporter [Dehalococcoidia bacterium]|nr:MFS transporter [Dehalococcoidia bacterium]